MIEKHFFQAIPNSDMNNCDILVGSIVLFYMTLDDYLWEYLTHGLEPVTY